MNLENKSLGVLMPHFKQCRALAPCTLARGIPYMENKSGPPQTMLVHGEPTYEPILMTSQDFQMLLAKKVPWIWTC